MGEGIFNHGIYWHSITTSLFQGGAIAMAVALVARLFAPRQWTVSGVDVRLANGTMVALLAVWNVAFAVLAGLTGLYTTWGFEAVTSVTLTMNKTMIGSFGLLALVLMGVDTLPLRSGAVGGAVPQDHVCPPGVHRQRGGHRNRIAGRQGGAPGHGARLAVGPAEH